MTFLISALVRYLHALGKSVLLTSYTHSAVDTVLLKLVENSDINLLRLGRQSRIHPRLRKFSAEIITDTIGDLDELKKLYSSTRIVATTCLGLNHPILQQRTFDYCIVDEAGQSTLLSALGPLFHANKFVLVGDPEQLPPVVQSKEAKELGLEDSLFTHLSTEQNTFPLNIQYRMNSTIMALANELVYHGELKCGSQDVADRVLKVQPECSEVLPWMERVISDQLQDAIVFLDTSSMGASEEASLILLNR